MKIEEAPLEKTDFVILYGELPTSRYLNWISQAEFIVSINTHIDKKEPANLVIPLPSYLDIDGTAIADDGRITKFRNPNQARYFDNILSIFHNMGILTQKQANPKHWKKEVQEYLAEEPEVTIYTNEKLMDYLHPIEDYSNYVPKFNSVQKIMLYNMKRMTKHKEK